MMTRDELEQALDRWGGDLAQWPAGESERAHDLLAADAGARRMLGSAQQLDGFLEALRAHAPPSHLGGRIAARITAPSTDAVDQALGWFTARLWRPTLVALLITTAGFLAGTAVSAPDVDAELAEDVMTLAFTDIYSELEDAQP